MNTVGQAEGPSRHQSNTAVVNHQTSPLSAPRDVSDLPDVTAPPDITARPDLQHMATPAEAGRLRSSRAVPETMEELVCSILIMDILDTG